MNFSRDWRLLSGFALWALLALPPLRHGLEGRMTLHMLAQLPALALVGWWLYAFLPQPARARLGKWNYNGISGLLVASLTTMAWMLPRSMDAALQLPWVELAKFFSVPVLIGLPLAASWPRAGFVVRGIFLGEVIATTFRLGWLYLISPRRLCSGYLLGEQQLLGRVLVAIGVGICLLVIWKLFRGDGGLPARSPKGSGR